jgi:hypothetical protein
MGPLVLLWAPDILSCTKQPSISHWPRVVGAHLIRIKREFNSASFEF